MIIRGHLVTIYPSKELHPCKPAGNLELLIDTPLPA